MAAEYILVVEDEPGIRAVIQPVLEDDGYRVFLAETGRDAIALASKARPIVAVLDYMLPDMSGVDIAVELRRRWGEDVPIIFMSAADMLPAELRRINAYLFLPKPFNIDDLSAAVRNAIDQPQPQVIGERADCRERRQATA